MRANVNSLRGRRHLDRPRTFPTRVDTGDHEVVLRAVCEAAVNERGTSDTGLQWCSAFTASGGAAIDVVRERADRGCP